MSPQALDLTFEAAAALPPCVVETISAVTIFFVEAVFLFLSLENKKLPRDVLKRI
jgi:hypothetical protein